jgi:hypothetical protein
LVRFSFYYLHPRILNNKSDSSVCTSWVLVTLQPWIAGHCHDDLLDVLWRVSTLLLLEDSNAQTRISELEDTSLAESMLRLEVLTAERVLS